MKMKMGKNLKYITAIEEYEFYEFTPTIFRLFLTNFEKLKLKRRIRYSIEFIRGYKIYYMFYKEDIVGYCMVARGGGYRLKFTDYNDIIIGPYFITKEFRGKGNSIVLLNTILADLGLKYKYAYDYIQKNNIPSIKASERVGFKFFSNAEISKFLRSIRLSDSQQGEFVVYRYHSNSSNF